MTLSELQEMYRKMYEAKESDFSKAAEKATDPDLVQEMKDFADNKKEDTAWLQKKQS